MITGWQPKMKNLPISREQEVIKFNFDTPQDNYFKQLLRDKDPSIAYVGDRPKDSTSLKTLL